MVEWLVVSGWWLVRGAGSREQGLETVDGGRETGDGGRETEDGRRETAVFNMGAGIIKGDVENVKDVGDVKDVEDVGDRGIGFWPVTATWGGLWPGRTGFSRQKFTDGLFGAKFWLIFSIFR